MDSAEIFHIGVPLQHPPISPRSLWEREPTEVSYVKHRPERSSRLWIQQKSFTSAYFYSVP
ncbi:hypothetical protein PS947_02175 [Pseudomonas fluorescens]|nr:hypothetical protein PS947_02175 [Pseudomonas fluorescens]